MNAIMQKVFEHRGYTQGFIDNLDNPSHPVLKDTDKVVARLAQAHDAHEKVVIIPDFDMDGIMSGVIGMAALDEMGFDVKLHVPNPQRGYGFDHDDIDEITERHPDVKVIVTCDTGITCYEGVDCANERGIDVLITDHHIPNDELPAALAVVDPYLDDDYDLKGICGAHVLWQTMMAYARGRCASAEQTRIDRLRVFAGIGTVSDSMPLLHENRQLVRDAIRLAKLVWCGGSRGYVSSIDGTPFYRAAFLGLYEVLDGLRSIGKLHEIDEDLFGFYLAPTFNAVKRMGGSLQRAFLAFFTPDRVTDGGVPIDMSGRRREHVDYLLELNEERKRTVERVVEDTLSRKQPYAPYIYVTDVDGGMAGLVAGKLEGDSGMPCVVVSWDGDHYAGSGRAPSSTPISTACSTPSRTPTHARTLRRRLLWTARPSCRRAAWPTRCIGRVSSPRIWSRSRTTAQSNSSGCPHGSRTRRRSTRRSAGTAVTCAPRCGTTRSPAPACAMANCAPSYAESASRMMR